MKKIMLLSVLISACVAAVPAEPGISGENWELFREVYSLVLDTHVEPRSPGQLLAGAMEGLAGATGPECGYIPKARLEETEVAEKSGFYLPLYITKNGGFANVISTFAGEDREIEPGDILRFVNGRSVYDMNFPQLVVAMKGREGEEVTCGFIKNDSFKPYEKKLTVKKPVGPVFHDLKDKGAALEIPCLEAGFGQELKDKIARTSGKVVIDLRGCASSDEEKALALAGTLFGKGSLKFAAKEGTVDIAFTGDGILKERKVVVIVDGTTARGGEVLALAAAGRGVIVGEETFGFSALHEKITLKNGDALVILTGYFLDRDGREIKEKPMKPDQAYDVTDKSRKDDYYLKAATKDFKKEQNGSN